MCVVDSLVVIFLQKANMCTVGMKWLKNCDCCSIYNTFLVDGCFLLDCTFFSPFFCAGDLFSDVETSYGFVVLAKAFEVQYGIAFFFQHFRASNIHSDAFAAKDTLVYLQYLATDR